MGSSEFDAGLVDPLVFSVSSGHRIQIHLQGAWKDCTADDAKLMLEQLSKGVLRFTIRCRGQEYLVDLTAKTSASQTNVSTGKKRMLRLFDPSKGSNVKRPASSNSEAPPSSSAGSGTSKVSRLSPIEIAQQVGYGPQSLRGGCRDPISAVAGDAHAKMCFQKLLENERKLCGEWAVFYHSYSFAALIYEVQAAVGSVLFRFRSQYASLPRLLVKDFEATADAASLLGRFNKEFAHTMKDHHHSYRSVAVSCMCSLGSTGPEASPAGNFIKGYSCTDLSFRRVLETLLESCYVPKAKVQDLASQIIALSEKHGLDVSQFGGRACGSGKAGHLLQIFVRRTLVDRLAYAAKPYGYLDEARSPLSTWVNSNTSAEVGQARVVANPKFFMRADCVRLNVASADPTFHKNRKDFQTELVGILSMILGEPSLRRHAATGVYGGTLPSWWSAEDQRQHDRF
mmetsp:Transcript_83059/g.173877  ORF Transcript_83059/g.173877 Transcript_83059/m.173877 type:complete len:455 (+) Transcript_83059:111-1475(+)